MQPKKPKKPTGSSKQSWSDYKKKKLDFYNKSLTHHKKKKSPSRTIKGIETRRNNYKKRNNL